MTALIPPYTQSVFNKTNLYFANNFDEWVSLPAWGTFFINLGGWVAQAQTGRNRLVLGLAIPTRNYAAALVALGVVLAKTALPNPRMEINIHFEQLCMLAKGTPVFYQKNGRRLKGIYQGVEEVGVERRLRIQTEDQSSGGLTHLVSVEQSHNLTIASTQNTSLPKKQTGRCLVTHNEFLKGVISQAELCQFATKTRLDCAVIGRVSVLRHEIKEIPFACSLSKDEYKTGTLQDLLRVRSFLSEGEAYHSEILPAQGNTCPQTVNGLVPHVTIFDGATGFLKWRDDWRNSHWIVLLNRTEPRFPDAVTEINKEYETRVYGEEIQNIPSPSPGVELVVYQKARQ